MAAIRRQPVSGRGIGARIAQALGLQSTRHIEIIIPLEGAVTVRVEYYPTAEEMDNVEAILRDYHIMPMFPEESA